MLKNATLVIGTYIPGIQNQTIALGNYLSGVQTIKWDVNLVAGNIVKGKSTFGVTGTYTSYANTTVADIAVEKTDYVNGVKTIGNASSNSITISSSEVSYKTGRSSTTVSAAYSTKEKNEYVVCISVHGGGVTTNGLFLLIKLLLLEEPIKLGYQL